MREAESSIKSADHILYVTYPLVKDKQILIRAIIETKNAITKIINSILQYDYIFKRITLSKDPKENIKIFEEKSSINLNRLNL